MNQPPEMPTQPPQQPQQPQGRPSQRANPHAQQNRGSASGAPAGSTAATGWRQQPQAMTPSAAQNQAWQGQQGGSAGYGQQQTGGQWQQPTGQWQQAAFGAWSQAQTGSWQQPAGAWQQVPNQQTYWAYPAQQWGPQNPYFAVPQQQKQPGFFSSANAIWPQIKRIFSIKTFQSAKPLLFFLTAIMLWIIPILFSLVVLTSYSPTSDIHEALLALIIFGMVFSGMGMLAPATAGMFSGATNATITSAGTLMSIFGWSTSFSGVLLFTIKSAETDNIFKEEFLLGGISIAFMVPFGIIAVVVFLAITQALWRRWKRKKAEKGNPGEAAVR